MEYSVPTDGANINKKINVCACKELSDLVSSGDPCLAELDEDTLDISSCPSITQCYDGLQDVSRVKHFLVRGAIKKKNYQTLNIVQTSADPSPPIRQVWTQKVWTLRLGSDPHQQLFIRG